MPEPPDGRDTALMREAKRALADIRAAVDIGMYESAHYDADRWLEVGGAARFLFVEVTTRPRGGREDRGTICLAWVGGRFLKIRVTSTTREAARLHAVGFA